MLNSIIILAIVVLPGWISLSVNQRYYPRIVDRSTVMSWGILLYHAMIVHTFVIVVFAVQILIWRDYFLVTLDLDLILTDGLVDFAKRYPIYAFTISGLYGLLVVAVSMVSAILDMPSAVINTVGRVAFFLKLAPLPVTDDEPVWFGAFNLDRRGRDKSNVQVYVHMKNGDIYVGDLEHYSIWADSEESRDLILGDSVRYPAGDTSSPVELDFSNYWGGGVLLNTKNISSIEYMFHDDYKWDGRPATD